MLQHLWYVNASGITSYGVLLPLIWPPVTAILGTFWKSSPLNILIILVLQCIFKKSIILLIKTVHTAHIQGTNCKQSYYASIVSLSPYQIIISIMWYHDNMQILLLLALQHVLHYPACQTPQQWHPIHPYFFGYCYM
jgi:hypothetical protein